MCLNPDKDQNIMNYIKLLNPTPSVKVNTVLTFNITHSLILPFYFILLAKFICIQLYLTSFVHYAMRFTNTAKVAIYVSSFITLLSPLLSPFLSFSFSQVKLLFKNLVAILSIRIDSLQQSPFSVKNNLGNGLSCYIKPNQTNQIDETNNF